MSTIWYDKMEITEEAKKRRVDLSLLFCEIIIMFFDMVMAENRSHEQLVGWLTERLNVIASKELKADNIAYINDWSRKEAEHIVDVTERHYEEIKSNDWADVIIKTDENGNKYTYKPKEVSFEEFGISIPEKDYWTSDIRGILLGIECASAVENFRELYDAINRGDNRKVWKTEGDSRVRSTHVAVDGVDIPINELFQVGNSYLLFPGDIQNGAEPQEVDNCRCHLVTYRR